MTSRVANWKEKITLNNNKYKRYGFSELFGGMIPQQTSLKFRIKNGIKYDLIWTIYKTKQGELLFGGEYSGGMYKFNGISFDRIYE